MPRTRVVLIASIAALIALAACSSSKTSTSGTTTRPPAPSTTSTGAGVTASTAAPASSTATSPSPGPPTSTTTGVRIVTFTGPRPPVTCNAPTSIEIHFETQHAKSVTLSINGGGVFATYTDGAHDELVPLTCAGARQKYVLTAHGSSGAAVSKTLTVEPRMLATS